MRKLVSGVVVPAAMLAIVATAGCAGKTDHESRASAPASTPSHVAAGSTDAGSAISAQKVLAVLDASFKPEGQAGMDRFKQDPTQAACSKYAPGMPPTEVAQKLMAFNRSTVQYPADGQYLGDWKAGMAIANNGKGFQYTDNPNEPAGGNCLACHKMDQQHVAYGTIGPSLYHYGKIHGDSPAELKLAWSMIYDMKGYHVCTWMPRFGSKHILTEQQLKDVMALLFDANSPVNQ